MTNANQKLQNFNQENIIEINKLKKEKSVLENQHREHFKQIQKSTADHVSIRVIFIYLNKNVSFNLEIGAY